MFLTFLALLVLGGFAFRVMTVDERKRAMQSGIAALPHIAEAVRGGPEGDTFLVALRERCKWTRVTGLLAGLNLVVFLRMLFGAGAFSDPATLVAWGANFGPRTTNGEWWRLLTALFVHQSFLHVVINVFALLQLGSIVERLSGPLCFGIVYLVGGILCALVGMSDHPLVVFSGAEGGIFATSGFLLSASVWALLGERKFFMSRVVATRVAPTAGVFLLYHLAGFQGGDVAALGIGLACGGFLAKDVNTATPNPKHVAAAFAGAAVVALVLAFPLRGLDDPRPEIANVVALEADTAKAYDDAVVRYRKRQVSSDALVQLIEQTIVPRLQAAETRLQAMDKVAPEHEPLVAKAEEYIKLRNQSWRLRADGLRRMKDYEVGKATLRDAEITERASLDALKKLQAP